MAYRNSASLETGTMWEKSSKKDRLEDADEKLHLLTIRTVHSGRGQTMTERGTWVSSYGARGNKQEHAPKQWRVHFTMARDHRR